MAAICEREEDEGFDRLDFSLEAWESGHRPPRLFSFWKTKVAVGETRQKVFVDDEVLIDLFQRLADDQRPQRRAFRFVLTLILMRKRLLRFIGSERDETSGLDRWRMRMRGMPPEAPDLHVLNPGLVDDDVRELTAQLGEVLAGDFG